MNKICNICKISKNIIEFRPYKNKLYPGKYYNSYCRICERAKNKQYKKDNKEKISKYNKEYMKNYNKQYYNDNKEKLITYQEEYRENNCDKIKITNRKHYVNNREKIIQNSIKYKKIKRKEDPLFRLREAISSYIRLFINKNNKSFIKYLPYTVQELKTHLESQFEPWMNWNNHGVYDSQTWNDSNTSTWAWQIDHIIPHSTFTYFSMEDEEFKKCWALDNLRPYSAKQNIIDGNRR